MSQKPRATRKPRAASTAAKTVKTEEATTPEPVQEQDETGGMAQGEQNLVELPTQEAQTSEPAKATEKTQTTPQSMLAQPDKKQDRVINLGSRIQVKNTGNEIQMIPLGDRRKRLVPNEIWTVEDKHVETVKAYFKTEFYQALEAGGFLKIHTSTPTSLGEADFKSSETPEPPDDLVDKPEHVHQQEFVKEDK